MVIDLAEFVSDYMQVVAEGDEGEYPTALEIAMAYAERTGCAVTDSLLSNVRYYLA